MTKLRNIAAVCAAVALLAACGGGSDDTGPPPAATDVVPPEAGQSVSALKKLLDDMVAAPSDEREPLDLGRFTAPTSEDGEPEPLG